MFSRDSQMDLPGSQGFNPRRTKRKTKKWPFTGNQVPPNPKRTAPPPTWMVETGPNQTIVQSSQTREGPDKLSLSWWANQRSRCGVKRGHNSPFLEGE